MKKLILTLLFASSVTLPPLATAAVPQSISYQGKLVRDQIVEGSTLAAIAKGPIAAFWTANKALPADNASIALPAADKVVNNMVRAVTHPYPGAFCQWRGRQLMIWTAKKSSNYSSRPNRLRPVPMMFCLTKAMAAMPCT